MAPIDLLETFDDLCEQHAITRTAMLLDLMRRAIVYRGNEIEMWNEEIKKTKEHLREHKALLRARFKANGSNRQHYPEDIEEPIGIWMPGMDEDSESDSGW